MIAEDQVRGPRWVIGGGDDRVQAELAERKVNAVDTQVLILGQRLVVGDASEDGLWIVRTGLEGIA